MFLCCFFKSIELNFFKSDGKSKYGIDVTPKALAIAIRTIAIAIAIAAKKAIEYCNMQ